MRKCTCARLAIGVLVIASALAAPIPANATSNSPALAAVRSVMPESISSIASKFDHDGDNLIAKVSDVTTAVPSDARGGIVIGIPGRDKLTIGLPKSSNSAPGIAADGTMTYEHSGWSSVVLLNSNSSVSVDTVIQSSAASSVYEYPISTPKGVSLLLDNGGGVTVSDLDGHFVSYILPSTARDASGAAVTSRYQVNGQTLTQVIEHRGAVYPVIATATAASRYFSKVIVDTTADSRGSIVRVYPIGSGPPPNIPAAAVFSDYKTLVIARYEGQKFRDQLICHVQNARGKSPWNLDEWRPNVGYPATVAALCNP